MTTNMKQFINELEGKVNNFGFRSKNYIEEVLADEAFADEVRLIGAFCALSLAYTYGVCERCDHWDDRNKASSIWAYEHKDAILKFLEDETGEPFPFLPSEYRGRQYFLRDIDMRRLDDNLKEGLSAWMQCHHTLQQRMMGVFVSLLAKSNHEGFADSDVVFPFI